MNINTESVPKKGRPLKYKTEEERIEARRVREALRNKKRTELKRAEKAKIIENAPPLPPKPKKTKPTRAMMNDEQRSKAIETSRNWLQNNRQLHNKTVSEYNKRIRARSKLLTEIMDMINKHISHTDIQIYYDTAAANIS